MQTQTFIPDFFFPICKTRESLEEYLKRFSQVNISKNSLKKFRKL